MFINILTICYVAISSTVIYVQKKKIDDCKELIETAKKNVD